MELFSAGLLSPELAVPSGSALRSCSLALWVLSYCWGLSFLSYKVGEGGGSEAQALRDSRKLELILCFQEQWNLQGLLFQPQAGDLLCGWSPKGGGEEMVAGSVGEGLVRSKVELGQREDGPTPSCCCNRK